MVRAARVVAWAVVPAMTAVAVAGGPPGAGALFLVPLLTCWAVGVVVTGRAPGQPAGWAFLGLATAMSWTALTGELDGPLVRTFDASSFVWWFVFLALVVQLAPATRPADRFTRLLPAATVGTGVVYQVAALIRPQPLDPPDQDVVSPWALRSIAPVPQVVATVTIYLLGLCLVASVVVLVRAWRRSEGETRRQLLWLVAGAIPVAPAVVVAFVASAAGDNLVAATVLVLAMATLSVGAGLSVLRYRLYDVERVVTESGAYAVAAVAVVAAYAAALVVITRTTTLDGPLPVVAATLAGVAVARAAYLWGRRAVGRRVNRRRFDAVETARAGLAAGGSDLDAVLAAALGAGTRVLYPAGDGAWIDAAGRPARPAGPTVEVTRRGAAAARLEHPADADPATVAAVVREAAAEIDNVALRAELARQVEVVTESRRRLAGAHLEERRRIERDLHDGAQQRLLALAMRLRATGSGSEVDRAVAELRRTVEELRTLAAGLQPAALAGGGLLAAVGDLAAHSPLTIRYDVPDRRFPGDVESAVWFVIAEAVTNVVKHGRTDVVSVSVRDGGGRLRVCVEDAGAGGADPAGGGLQGLADRVAAFGGTLAVSELDPGTRVEATLPCAW